MKKKEEIEKRSANEKEKGEKERRNVRKKRSVNGSESVNENGSESGIATVIATGTVTVREQRIRKGSETVKEIANGIKREKEAGTGREARIEVDQGDLFREAIPNFSKLVT